MKMLSEVSQAMTEFPEQMFRGKLAQKTLMKAVVSIVCMADMLYGPGAYAAGWSQNLGAKPVELPLGLKFGEVYEGAIRSTNSNYMNGIELKRCDAVITNNWLGFEEIVVMMTGKRRVDGVFGTKSGFKDFDEAMINLVTLKETLSQKYGINFMGDMEPKTMGSNRSLYIMGSGAGDESVTLHADSWRKDGEGKPRIDLSIGIHSQAAARIESKELEAETASLRAAIKAVFGVDFDTPQPKAFWGFEWEKLPEPIEGLTEWRRATSHVIDAKNGNMIESVAFRRVFDGDVSSAELEAAAQRIVVALEEAYGQKLPDESKNLRLGKDYGVPAAYDATGHGANQHFVAYGAVGTLIVSIEYAEPRYALRGGKYVLVFKGGVQFSVARTGWMK